MTRGVPSVYSFRSEGSGKMVHVHFCPACGTKLYLSFERVPGDYGVYAGTFDNPNWFEMRRDSTKQIFIERARADTILHPGINSFGQHTRLNDGTTMHGEVFDAPRFAGGKPIG